MSSLIETLQAVHGTDGCYFDDDAYLDWSSIINGVRHMEVGDGEGTVSLRMTRARMLALHAALSATLLADPA